MVAGYSSTYTLVGTSLETSSMKNYLTETQEHNFESHNIVLSSQSITLIYSYSFLFITNNNDWPILHGFPDNYLPQQP